jgi:hypothetical protein
MEWSVVVEGNSIMIGSRGRFVMRHEWRGAENKVILMPENRSNNDVANIGSG